MGREEEEDSLTQSDEQGHRVGKKKKGKLSVLFAAAKHWQKQQEKSAKIPVDNVYEFNEDEGEPIDDTSDDPSDEPRDNIKHSKAAKSKFLKNRAKHKDYKKK